MNPKPRQSGHREVSAGVGVCSMLTMLLSGSTPCCLNQSATSSSHLPVSSAVVAQPFGLRSSGWFRAYLTKSSLLNLDAHDDGGDVRAAGASSCVGFSSGGFFFISTVEIPDSTVELAISTVEIGRRFVEIGISRGEVGCSRSNRATFSSQMLVSLITWWRFPPWRLASSSMTISDLPFSSARGLLSSAFALDTEPSPILVALARVAVFCQHLPPE